MLHSKRIPSICLLSSLLCAAPAFAYEFQDSYEAGYFTFRAQGGAGWLTSDSTSTLGVTETEYDTVEFNDSHVSGIISAGVGYVFPFREDNRDFRWFPAVMISVDASYLLEAELSGDVWMYGDPAFDNYTNNTEVQTATGMFNVTLPIFDYNRWTMYVVGGVGAAWNWVEYKDAPKEGVPPGSGITLTDNTNTTFAFQGGAGIGYEILSDLDLTLTYLYTDMGDVETSSTVSSPNAPDLTINPASFDLNQQSVMLGLQWNFL